jgi:hypothetical protein
MKAYLVTTGILFALLAALHVWRIVVEWNGLGPSLWVVGAGTVLSALLAAWAAVLLRRPDQRG